MKFTKGFTKIFTKKKQCYMSSPPLPSLTFMPGWAGTVLNFMNSVSGAMPIIKRADRYTALAGLFGIAAAALLFIAGGIKPHPAAYLSIGFLGLLFASLIPTIYLREGEEGRWQETINKWMAFIAAYVVVSLFLSHHVPLVAADPSHVWSVIIAAIVVIVASVVLSFVLSLFFFIWLTVRREKPDNK